MLLACDMDLAATRLTIDCDDAHDRLEIRDNGEAVAVFEAGRPVGTWRGVEAVHVRTAGGDDSVLYVGEAPVAPGVDYVPSRLILVETGFGDDVARYRGHALAHELTHVWQGGPGDDSIDLDIEAFPSDPAAPIAAQIDVDGGDGIDRLAANWRQSQQNAMPVQFDLTMSPGEAGDSRPVVLEGQQCLVFFLGGVPDSPDRPIIIGSVYNARTAIPGSSGGMLHLAVDTLSDSPSVAVDVLGTDGRDDVSVDVRSPVETTIGVGTGAGDDSVHVRHRFFAIVDRTHLNNINLYLGAGNDNALVIAHRDGRTDAGTRPAGLDTLEVVARLGAGRDTMQVLTQGYQRILTDIDTGPLGDGRDLVTGVHVAPGAGRPIRRLVTPLDGGSDYAVWLTIGFFEVTESTEQTRQITIIQDL
jgi:hypothetical protein